MLRRYHSLHHTEKDTNFCLFMPIFDKLGNTLNKNSWGLHKKLSSASGKCDGWFQFFNLTLMQNGCQTSPTTKAC